MPSMQRGLLSVVIPAYNEEARIETIVERVRGAEIGVPIELIVVDDGSKDTTRTILERLARNGRIDRVLQPSPEVRCHYFTYPARAEDLVLRTVVKKVDRITRELGSLSGVVYEQVEQALARGIRKHTGEAVGAISETPLDEQRAAARERKRVHQAQHRAAMREHWQSLSEEERAAARQKHRERVEQRRQHWEGMSEEDKAAARQRFRDHRGGGHRKRHEKGDGGQP